MFWNIINNSKAKKVLGLFTVVSLCTLGVFKFSNTNNSNFDYTKTKKYKHYKHIKAPLIHSTQKLSGPIDVQFSTLRNESVEPNEPFTLVLKISSRVDIDIATIQWKIPEGVEHLDGSLPESVSISSKSPTIIEAGFRVKESKNYQIHALVSSKGQSINFVKTAQFNTYVYRELKDKLKVMKSTNKNYVENQKKFETLE